MQRWVKIPIPQRPKEVEFSVTYAPSLTVGIKEQGDEKRTLRKLHIRARSVIDTTPLQLTASHHPSGSNVAWGSSENIFQVSEQRNKPVLVALTAKADGARAASIMIPGFNEAGNRVVDMTFYDDEDNGNPPSHEPPEVQGGWKVQ